MRTLTAPDRPPATGRPSGRGRWIWTLAGVVTVGLLTVPAVAVITKEGNYGGNGQVVNATPTRTVTVSQPISSLSVDSYGAPIQVTAEPVHSVTITESLSYDSQAGPAPVVTDAVSNGMLSLAAPGCATNGCSVGFSVIVPSGVAVTADSDNGSIAVAGAAGANLDSGGGPVQASRITGPLTISSENGSITVDDVTAPSGINLDSGGGPVQASGITGPLTISSENGGITISDVSTTAAVDLDSGGGDVQVSQVHGPLTVTSENGGITVNGLTGDLQADTGGGQFSGDDLATAKASVVSEDGAVGLSFSTAPAYVLVGTGGGPAELTFDAAPTTVMVTTGNGSATLNVPGGPYAVAADSGGGQQTVDVPIAANAQHSLTVNTDGGPLDIAPQ
jgi:hypothetical protein